MNTVFCTGPGLFAVNTASTEPGVAPGQLRIYVARVEAYDLDSNTNDLDAQFKILPAMAENKPEVARAMVRLHNTLEKNLETLKVIAARS